MKTTEQFQKDFETFNALDGHKRFVNKWNDRQPCLSDNTAETYFDAHYIYHPAWACRIVKRINPAVHIDISSTLTFAAQLSAFIPVHFYDYRPARITLSNFSSMKVDLNELPFADNSIESISCMHTIEHIGLGRYGDKIDPEGDSNAFQELMRVVRPGGHLLIVVPMGKPKIKFNAHRIYSYEMVADIFKTGFQIRNFSFIDDLNRYT